MMKRLLVVGSGTAGLVAATILKTQLGVDIDVISSKKIDIIGVGEGSTKEFESYMKFVGISNSDIIENCGATLKSGIMFEGWNKDKDYLEVIESSLFDHMIGQYNPVISKLIIDKNLKPSDIFWKSQMPTRFLDKPESPITRQYHFDSRKLNDYLIEFSKGVGIGFIEDVVENVVLSENGEIKSVQGELSEYNYDFYIDATGFKRLLIGEMGSNWESYSKYLKLNSAITFETKEEEEYNLWTLSKAMDAGWLFRIPVQGRYGNGYIFDDNYISEGQAKKEVEDYFGREINVGKKFKFDPGAIDRPWIKNCVAVGLSSAFVEPLEASSIATTIQQTFLLMHRITNYNEKSIESYNKSFKDVMENVRDFIALHYVTNRNDTQFWRDVSNLELPKTLKSKLELWKKKLPISEDFSNLSDYIIFREYDYTFIMDGLDLFDIDSIKKEFESIRESYQIETNHQINNRNNRNNNLSDLISHKEYINHIRGGIN